MIDWLLAFTATCAIELAVVRALLPPNVRTGVLALRPRGERAGSRGSWLAIALGAQLATHPLVWIAMATLPGSQLVRLACVELGAVLIEAAIYHGWLRIPAGEAFALSALANAASLLVVAACALVL